MPGASGISAACCRRSMRRRCNAITCDGLALCPRLGGDGGKREAAKMSSGDSNGMLTLSALAIPTPPFGQHTTDRKGEL